MLLFSGRMVILLYFCTGKVCAQRNNFTVCCLLCFIATAHESELACPDKDSVSVPFYLSTNFAVVLD